MTRKVKGTFFADYVRMIRSRKDVDWAHYLTPEDMQFLSGRISESEWYPFEAFERMGLGILAEIAGGNMEAVRLFGRATIDNLFSVHQSLIREGDPKESLIRFQVVRRSFFDFDPVSILVIYDNFAKLRISYGMSPSAEEAATWQTLGYFERILELSGAVNIGHSFTSKMWEGDQETVLELEWSSAVRGKMVKGAFFAEYVRMIRGRKDVDWKKLLKDQDLPFLEQRILDSEWYPFEAFERMAVAIFKEVAGGNMEVVRRYGRTSIDNLYEAHHSLVADGDPRESLMRYQVLRRSFFDFDPVVVRFVAEQEAELRILYGMTNLAEQVCTYQVLGYFERLLELSGARDLEHKFASRVWEGDQETILKFKWEMKSRTRRVRGTLFLDYVRMIKARKDSDWKKYLNDADMAFLDREIMGMDWYPMESYERMGVGILNEYAGGNMELVRRWGRLYMEGLFNIHEALIHKGDPKDSMMRFQVLRRSFFDYEPIRVKSLSENSAVMEIAYGMGKPAEEAATWQSVGFFEHLLTLAGAKKVDFKFEKKAWEGAPATVLVLEWSTEGPAEEDSTEPQAD